jgi:hypothetical protein
LALVQDDKKSISYRAVIRTFLLVGLTSMGTIQYGFGVILFRISELEPSFRASILSQVVPRSVLTFVGIGVGAAIFVLAEKLQVNRTKQTVTTS